jgi:hypothetical protein
MRKPATARLAARAMSHPRPPRRRFPLTLAALALLGNARPDAATAAPSFLIANDDTAVPFPPSTVSFYPINPDGGLGARTAISTQGNGMAGGYFGADRLLIVTRGAATCVFASNAQSESIAVFEAASHVPKGVFTGSHADTTLAPDGIGLAASGNRLYANFAGANSIGAFRIEPDCQLRFLGDVTVRGLSGGTATSLAARGNMMVLAYTDGSAETFDIANDLPVSHDDARYTASRDDDFTPGAVAITSDGHKAIFGGASTITRVQVADLATGRLGATKLYTLAGAWNAGSIRLGPDETMLYISNSSAGRVTAAFFDKHTGTLRPGCVSPPLRGFYKDFTQVGAAAIGAGGLLYIPEFNAGGKSAIATLHLSKTVTGCALQETAASPTPSGPASALLSIAISPPPAS